MSTLSTQVVTTDLEDYEPASTAYITASGFTAGSTLTFQVQHVVEAGSDGVWGTSDDVLGDNSGGGHEAWYVIDGGAGDLDGLANGVIQTTWYVNPDDSFGATFRLTASGTGEDGVAGNGDDEVATDVFTDAALALFSWRNVGTPEWNSSGTIQQANSIFAEGDVIPFRWTSTAGGGASPNLVENQTYTIQLDWGYAGGTTSPLKLFIDYLTTYNATEAATVPFGVGSDLAGFTTGLVSTVVIPNDAGDTGGVPANPATVAHAAGVFTLFNINPASVVFGAYAADPVNAGQEDRLLNITFTVADDGDANTAETKNVGVAWGAHLAKQSDYGLGNGAAAFPGASPQMVVDFDPSTSGGTTNLNINPNAIVPQGQITIIKDALPNALQNFSFTLTRPDGTSTVITLDDDSGVVGADATFSNQHVLFGLAPGNYTITEASVSGWTLTNLVPVENGVEDTTAGDISSVDTGTRTAVITVADGEVWTVTFSNTFVPNPAIAIVKTAELEDGGPAIDQVDDVINYTITVTNTVAGSNPLTGVQVDDQVESYAAELDLVLVSGDTNGNDKLDFGESWIYETSYTVTQDDFDDRGGGDDAIDNIATVTANEDGPETDDATVPFAEGSIFSELTLAKDGEYEDVGAVGLNPGDKLNYTFEVTNTGTVTITSVDINELSFDLPGPIVITPPADVDLSPGESQTWNGVYTLTQADINAIFLDNDIDNEASATGQDPADVDVTSNEDPAQITLTPTASLVILKSLTNGNDAVVDLAGETIEYTIVVDNTGNVDLTNVVLDDVFAGGATYVSGDTNDNDILETTETWTYSADYVVTQGDINDGDDLVNVAGVTTDQTARETDDATSTVDQNPSLEITKVANKDAVNAAGQSIGYTIVLTNTGNVTLTNVDISDSLIAALGAPSKSLNADNDIDLGETWTYTPNYAVQAIDISENLYVPDFGGGTGDHGAIWDGDLGSIELERGGGDDGDIDNTVTVETDQTAEQEESADVDVAGITIEKFVSVDGGTTWVDADSPTGPTLVNTANTDPKFKLVVINTGNVEVTDIEVTDTKGTADIGDDLSESILSLASGATWSYEYSLAWKAGQQTNTASVEGDYVMVGGETEVSGTVSDTDNANYFGAMPALVTDSSLCTFGDSFNLIFSPDFKNAGSYRIADTNPGQFYYNMFDYGTEGETKTYSFEIPYPFVTQGAVPVHVYSSVEIDEHDGELCLTPGDEIDNFKVADLRVTDLDGDGKSEYSFDVTFDGTNFVYINMHLDYGLEKQTGWVPGANGQDAVDNASYAGIQPSILEGTNYAFSALVDGSQLPASDDSIYNDNIFKKIKGLGGMSQINLKSTEGNDEISLAGQHFIVKDSKGALMGDARSDADGWYFSQFLATGKQTAYNVYWDRNDNNKVDAGEVYKSVQMGGAAGKWANVDFTVVDPVGYNPDGNDYKVDSFAGLQA
jgi:uncharacterized repeat protein (TIGR01451 family)